MSNHKKGSGTGLPTPTSDKHTAVVTAPIEVTPAKTELTREELDAALMSAMTAKDIKAVLAIGRQIEALEKRQAEAKKAELSKRMDVLTSKVRNEMLATARRLVDSGELDGCDGIWFSWDFGSPEQELTIRLLKSTPRKSSGVAGSSSYVTNDAKSADLLAKFGQHVMFDKETEVTIDKQKVAMPAGMNFNQAYKYSSNGGWRNRVRQALLKEAGLK